MSRSIRIQFAGAIYHVMSRGDRYEPIFWGDQDRRIFLKTLGEVCERTGWIVHAYVLMKNHYHWLLETPEPNLVDSMKWFQSTYTKRFNGRNKLVGHLFQGRYKAIVCDKDAYLLELVRYIHLNPLRAGLVDGPEDYPWSSHRIHIGEDRSEAIDPSLVLGQFAGDFSAAKKLYESFVMEGTLQGRREDLYKVSDQRILGNETFYKQVFKRRRGEEGELVGMPTVHFELDELEEIMEKAMGVESGFLRSGGQFGASMRRIFCYVARTYGAHKGKDVAAYIGRDQATVTQAVRSVEKFLDVGDQKTMNAIKRVQDEIAKRRVSGRKKGDRT